ncbi:rhomboid family intramembrane serine protease [Frigoriflavimonas asaccharolytica]|uniref:Membrane associated rhomboid family serine protease n=1 Tax=Frigoriflavimonas asaccharolytica TaxID=2735899 RepID=A0A8J8G459_9FLAO|nr:rhomboid family intramembrane serine protease [Frigoriflavimonas asaccharolytica]NRS91138.1 membrane associated rhomboid family serine protease [Frigoriflavimonas asaccharolytica]
MFRNMFGQLTPITKNIIILNVIMYLASNFFMQDKMYELFSAFYVESPYFKVWQVVTHMFMHAPFDGGAGIMHIVFNMFTLLSFGPIIEKILGEKKFVILYFLSGFGAFALHCLWNYFEIAEHGANINIIYGTPLVGASGAIAGIVAAFTMIAPDSKIAIMFIPIGIKAKYLMTAALVASLYFGINGEAGGIAHFAHIGGAIVGFIYMYFWKKDKYRIA